MPTGVAPCPGLERYDFEKKAIIVSYRKSAPKPDPLPDWATPFMGLWPEVAVDKPVREPPPALRD